MFVSKLGRKLGRKRSTHVCIDENMKTPQNQELTVFVNIQCFVSILSYFGLVLNYLVIEENLKIIVFLDSKTTKR